MPAHDQVVVTGIEAGRVTQRERQLRAGDRRLARRAPRESRSTAIHEIHFVLRVLRQLWRMTTGALELDRAVVAGEHDDVGLDHEFAGRARERIADVGGAVAAADVAEANGERGRDAL